MSVTNKGGTNRVSIVRFRVRFGIGLVLGTFRLDITCQHEM